MISVSSSLLSIRSVEPVLYDTMTQCLSLDWTELLRTESNFWFESEKTQTTDTFVLRILKLLCSGTIGCSRWRCSLKLSPDGSRTAAESWRNHRKQTIRHIRVNKLDRLEKHSQKSLDVDKGWEAEGVTPVQEKSHWMWLVWWPGEFSPRPLQPPSDQWWGGAPTAPNSLSLNDEQPVVLEWHGLGCGQSRHTLNTFVTADRMSFSTFTTGYNSQHYIWLFPFTILHLFRLLVTSLCKIILKELLDVFTLEVPERS